MKQFSYSIISLDDLKKKAAALHQEEAVQKASALLFEVFSSDPSESYIKKIVDIVADQFPNAPIVGSSTSGEIVNDDIHEHTIAFSCLAFTSSTVATFGFDCSSSQEAAAGEKIVELVASLKDVKGLEILADTKTINYGGLLENLSTLSDDITIFGGGADGYNNSNNTIVYNGRDCFSHGVAGAVMCGKDLFIEGLSSLGWKPLGIAREVSEVSNEHGTVLKTMDNLPAINIYEKYLHFNVTQNFHEYVEIFPMMVTRDGYDIARVPIDSYPDGSIYLGADVNVGEKVRLAYADPQVLIEKSFESAEQLANFQPQGILSFCCITRKGFLKEYASTDCKPFAQIAPTAGFYTYGEIFRLGKKVIAMNCTLVCIGIREGKAKETKKEIASYKAPLEGHMLAIGRLVNFVEATTDDLVKANEQLKYYAQHDRLTGLLNRGGIEKVLQDVVAFVDRDIYHASGMMIDVDRFKTINDTYGHAQGDLILKTIADVIRTSARKTDKAGRWGGDEFMVVLPGASEKDACTIAERIRFSIEECSFDNGCRATVSIGVSEIKKGEELMQFYNRVDQALYCAKEENRNRVIEM